MKKIRSFYFELKSFNKSTFVKFVLNNFQEGYIYYLFLELNIYEGNIISHGPQLAFKLLASKNKDNSITYLYIKIRKKLLIIRI